VDEATAQSQDTPLEKVLNSTPQEVIEA
jgi:hypothetical protein